MSPDKHPSRPAANWWDCVTVMNDPKAASSPAPERGPASQPPALAAAPYAAPGAAQSPRAGSGVQVAGPKERRAAYGGARPGWRQADVCPGVRQVWGFAGRAANLAAWQHLTRGHPLHTPHPPASANAVAPAARGNSCAACTASFHGAAPHTPRPRGAGLNKAAAPSSAFVLMAKHLGRSPSKEPTQ